MALGLPWTRVRSGEDGEGLRKSTYPCFVDAKGAVALKIESTY